MAPYGASPAALRATGMALRWAAMGFLEGEKSFRRIQDHRDLW
jgi:hypothetical protein